MQKIILKILKEVSPSTPEEDLKEKARQLIVMQKTLMEQQLPITREENNEYDRGYNNCLEEIRKVLDLTNK